MTSLEERTPGATPSLREQFLRRKPVTAMTEETGVDSGSGELARTIGLFQLSLFGIGATIGTGIFIVLTTAVPVAGPAVIWSFVMAGVVAGLTAICYAELASTVPVSGSSYSYAYCTLGEGIAMVVAACLLLEYGVSAAAVAVGWSQYLNELLDNVFGFTIPESLSNAPEADGIINLPAIILVGLCTLLLIRGASESAKVNAVMVLIKLGVLALFIVVGVSGWNSDNLSDFAPFGVSGITSAAGIIFFSYIGLDAVSTAGEEVKNPRRNLPLAIIIALVTVTSIYILVAVVAVAAQPVASFEGQEAGLSAILEQVTGSTWPASVLAAGAVVSIFSVTLVVIYGQTRILFAMGRDGMVPPIFHRLNPRTLTPVPATMIVAIVVSLLAGLLPINFLAEMTSIGTLTAFLIVSVGVMMLRYRSPELPRGFRVPLFPFIPIASIAGCIWIILDLRAVTIWVFLGWSAVALVWYFFYGRHHSMLGEAGVVSLLVGYAPDGRGRAVLHLAAVLARSSGDDVVLCAVVPASWPPSPARVDAEYQTQLARTAEDALERARERLPQDIPVTTVVHRARSAAAGLLEVAEQRGATLIVTGSSAAGGTGYVSLGSATSRLLHSSPVPVALAPRGYRAAPGARVTRVTAAFGGADDELVVAAAGVAARVGATLRLASFAVHPRAPYTVAVGRDADRSLIREWVAEIESAQRAVLARVGDLPDVPEACDAVVGRGESWEEALDDVEWHDGDVLVVGSSSIGPLARVFLGSRSSKIVQESPVPAVVVPRGVVTELAAAADADAGQRLADDALRDER